MRRIKAYFLPSYGIERADDRRIVSAIVFIIKNGLRWRRARRGIASPPSPTYQAHDRRGERRRRKGRRTQTPPPTFRVTLGTR